MTLRQGITAMPGKQKHRRLIASDRHIRHGFTLIEIIVVVTIIAILAGIIAPRIMQNVGKAKNSRAKSEAKQIAQLITTYMLDVQLSRIDDDFDLETLLLVPDDGGGPNGPYLQKRGALVDPWGNPYEIRIPGVVNYDFDVVSLGDDGEMGTEDDITN